MNLGKLGQAITGKEIFDLIHDDLERVEQEIRLETVASVEVVTNIGRYLQASGGKVFASFATVRGVAVAFCFFDRRPGPDFGSGTWRLESSVQTR